ncbi:hypothetical protein [Adlercreutzia sp. ZJ242]|uniref:hypothetical protein n=1 Tax=Adlercreutzia sp. ZJ242 TaxID=2709409 RepID=UPI0013ECAB8D|nr:hypothetical protein [Adlercreutzia sp. ZJ242]
MSNTVVVADLLLPKGHVDFNKKYLEALSANADTRVVPGLLGERRFSYEFFTPGKLLKPCEGKIAGRIQTKRNAAIASHYWKKVPGSSLVLLSSDPLMLLFSPHLRGNVLMVHHKSVDELCMSSIKRACFSLYKNRIHHAVGEPFIGRCLIDKLGVTPDRVHVCPHPIVEAAYLDDKSCSLATHDYDAVGLCGSNDSEFVRAIASFEERTSFFAKNNCRVYLKGDLFFNDGYLRISSERLDEAEYASMLRYAKISLSPVGLSFQNRVSGALLDGLSYRCVVVATPFKMAKCYSSYYSDLVYCEDDVERFCRRILNLLSERNLIVSREVSFAELFSAHSIEYIADTLSDALEAME